MDIYYFCETFIKVIAELLSVNSLIYYISVQCISHEKKSSQMKLDDWLKNDLKIVWIKFINNYIKD